MIPVTATPAVRRPVRAARPFLAMLSAALLLAACGTDAPSGAPQSRAAVRVIAEPLRFESERTRVEAVGTSRALQSINVHPASAGEVVAVNFAPGQRVEQGFVLVELDSRDERLAVELGRVRLADAERLFERYRRSADSGAVLPTQLDAAATQVDTARIELDRAQVALDDRFVKAPFAGHVDVTDVDPGDRIGESTLITTLDDRSKLLVSFEMPEVLVGDLQVDDPVSLVAWNREETSRDGQIVELSSRIDPVSRTFVARATVDNTDDSLRPGMSFRVSANVDGRTYPVITETALQWGADGAYVWLIVDGVAERHAVRIIQRQQGRVLVDGDFSAGDLVVVEGIQRMRQDLAIDYETTGYADTAPGGVTSTAPAGGH